MNPRSVLTCVLCMLGSLAPSAFLEEVRGEFEAYGEAFARASDDFGGETNEIDLDGPGIVGVQASYTSSHSGHAYSDATTSIGLRHHGIGVRAFNTTSGITSGEAYATSMRSDAVTFSPTWQFGAPEEITYTFRAYGDVYCFANPGIGGAEVDFRMVVSGQVIQDGFSVGWNDDFPIVYYRDWFDITVPFEDSISYTMEARAVATSSVGASSAATFNHTLELMAITVPEFGGVTPESLGVTLTFDSGAPSPNLVPEPSTWALWGSMMFLGLVAMLHRNRRRSATAE